MISTQIFFNITYFLIRIFGIFIFLIINILRTMPKIPNILYYTLFHSILLWFFINNWSYYFFFIFPLILLLYIFYKFNIKFLNLYIYITIMYTWITFSWIIKNCYSLYIFKEKYEDTEKEKFEKGLQEQKIKNLLNNLNFEYNREGYFLNENTKTLQWKKINYNQNKFIII